MVLTREYLATYTYLESEIKRIRRRIKYYKAHPLKKEYGTVKGSLQQFPFTEMCIMVAGVNPKSGKEREQCISQLLLNLQRNERIFEDMKLDIELFIESLPPEQVEVRQVLAYKYVDGMTDAEIADKICCCRRNVGRIIEKFLDRQKITPKAV